MVNRVIDESMRSYYDQRAGEYDDWWLGAGLARELGGGRVLFDGDWFVAVVS